MKRAPLIAAALAASLAQPAEAMYCESLARWPDMPQWLCKGEPGIDHPCAFWAAAGLTIHPVIKLTPTFPWKRLKCTWLTRPDARVYALWQTYLTYQQPWPSTKTVTEVMPADLKWFMYQCPVNSLDLP